MTNPADQFLLGSGGQSAKFEHIGDSITGTIISTDVQQQTDIITGAPLTWDNGDPRQQLVVRLQATETTINGLKVHQFTDPDDDGVRAIYVKGSKKAGTQSMHDAVASAVRAAGGKGLEEGGTLTVTFVGEEPPQQRGMSARKLWEASYVQPDRAAVSGSFLGTTEDSSSSYAAKQFATVEPVLPPGFETQEKYDNFLAWQASKKA